MLNKMVLLENLLITSPNQLSVFKINDLQVMALQLPDFLIDCKDPGFWKIKAKDLHAQFLPRYMISLLSIQIQWTSGRCIHVPVILQGILET